MAERKDTYFEEEDVVNNEVNQSPEQAQEEREQLQRRIDREVVLIDSEECDDEIAEEEEEEEDIEHDNDNEEDENDEEDDKRDKSLIQHIITGSLLTDGTVPYYRYFIAIAIMCFLSIVLTFLSLNANNECRRKEKQITLLHERSVVKEEQRYGLSSKSAITERLKNYNIELVDLSDESRLIE